MITKHHRRPQFLGGTDSKPAMNVSYVTQKTHQAWHTLFGHKTVHQIAEEINQTWIDPEWVLIPQRRQQPKHQLSDD